MFFDYTFSREEYIKANAKYMRRYTALILALAIIYAVLTVVYLVVAILDTVYNEPINDEKVGYQIYVMAFLTAIFFAVVFGLRVSVKRANNNFFDCYNEDGLLRYRVELTETEVVVSYKQNVSHLFINSIARVIVAGEYLYVLFRINSILIVKINDETKPLTEKLKSCNPTKNKKKD